MIRRSKKTSSREPTIALINIVFLMLVFFMVAGTLAPPLESDLSLVKATDLEGRTPPDTLVLMEDGSLRYRGENVADVTGWSGLVPGEPVRVVPDRSANAHQLLQLSRSLRAAGAEKVFIVTESALK